MFRWINSSAVCFMLLISQIGFDIVLCCSGITHTEIAERTREHFEIISQGVDYNEMLKRHEDAFQAGAPYPDAFYPSLCAGGEFHYVSEDTHWTPFINATVNYIREVYPKPWSRSTEKLVVFLLSIVTHQVADVNWHSLGIDQGFLTTMGNINYHGSYGSAHTDGDFGGDVLNLFGLDMSYIGKLAKWYVPTEDLLNIYDILYNGNSPMTAEIIENCTMWLFLGRLGENIGVVDKLYPFYANRSPFLTDRLQDYYLGGMDDMSVWSMNVWRHTVDMLDYGTEVCDLNHNPIYITCDKVINQKKSFRRFSRALVNHPAQRSAKLQKLRQSKGKGETEDIPFSSRLAESDVRVKRYLRGTKFAVKKDLLKLLKRREKNYMRKMQQEHELMYVEHIDDETVVDEPSAFLTTNQSYSRAGESLTTGYVNNDGYQDLVIGAPGYSSKNNIQQGKVFIIYGSDHELPSGNMTLEDEADMIIEGSATNPNGRFGHALAVMDINADGYIDLAVSAPSEGSDELNYNGKIYVFLGGEGGISSESFAISCTQRYCNLGWTLTSGDANNDGLADLIIGAPFAPAGGEQRGFVGVLYAKPTVGNDISELELDWILSGNQDYAWLGYSVEVASLADGSSKLIVGAPTYRDCAKPDCSYNEDDIQSVGQITIFETPLTSVPTNILTGTKEFQQLGFSLHSGQFGGDDYLFVTSVTADVITAWDNITQGGIVSAHAWADIIQNNPNATMVFGGDRSYGRFGFIVKTFDVDGDSENDLLITAALRSSTYFDLQESGRAFVFQADETYEGLNTVDQAHQIFGMDTNRIRFGYDAAILSSPVENYLVFGTPHSCQESRLGGGAAIFVF